MDRWYYILILIILLISLVIVAILISSETEDPEILSGDACFSVDSEKLKELAAIPFADIPHNKRLHGYTKLDLYNLSVHKTKDGYSGVARGSNYGGCQLYNSGPLFSYTYYVKLNNNGDVLETKLVNLDYQNMVSCKAKFTFSSNGTEDPKVFRYRGEQWVIANVLGHPGQTDVCANAMVIYQINAPKETFRIIAPPSNVNPKQTQKNWSLFQYHNDIYCEYSIRPHVILKLDMKTGTTIEIARTGKKGIDVTDYHSLRGGANAIKVILKDKEYYLNVGHVASGHPCDYKHFFYIFNASPPFDVLAISDIYKLDFKARIQFAAGISEHDDYIYVSYGISDCHNRIAVYSKEKIMSLFRYFK